LACHVSTEGVVSSSSMVRSDMVPALSRPRAGGRRSAETIPTPCSGPPRPEAACVQGAERTWPGSDGNYPVSLPMVRRVPCAVHGCACWYAARSGRHRTGDGERGLHSTRLYEEEIGDPSKPRDTYLGHRGRPAALYTGLLKLF
jgi:hypothetical protein